MTTIKIDSQLGTTGIYLTQAGALTLAAPCAMKEYISNNKRNADGRNYLSVSKRDDTQVSVQFVTMDSASTAMAAFNNLIGADGSITISGVKCLYKSFGSVSQQGAAVVFTVNLIKLADQS